MSAHSPAAPLGGRLLNPVTMVCGLLIAAIVTTLCALASWHWIEHPALGLKTRLAGSRLKPSGSVA